MPPERLHSCKAAQLYGNRAPVSAPCGFGATACAYPARGFRAMARACPATRLQDDGVRLPQPRGAPRRRSYPGRRRRTRDVAPRAGFQPQRRTGRQRAPPLAMRVVHDRDRAHRCQHSPEATTQPSATIRSLAHDDGRGAGAAADGLRQHAAAELDPLARATQQECAFQRHAELRMALLDDGAGLGVVAAPETERFPSTSKPPAPVPGTTVTPEQDALDWPSFVKIHLLPGRRHAFAQAAVGHWHRRYWPAHSAPICRNWSLPGPASAA